jgi:hypothetical protein
VDAVAVDQPYPAYHRHEQGSGHVWQGRFKAFPVQDDTHYLTMRSKVVPKIA